MLRPNVSKPKTINAWSGQSKVRTNTADFPKPAKVQDSSKLSLITELSWQELLQASKISVKDLLEITGNVSHPLADQEELQQFPLRVPAPYLHKIRSGDPNDPLLLQVLPQLAERTSVESFSREPLEEQSYSPLPGLIHKYRSRVLLVSTQACAIHCRYCFRRHFPYSAHQRSREEWLKITQYIAADPKINEIILSGGDPLSLSDRYLAEWLPKLTAIPHIKRLRIHTRMLPSLPQRITDELCRQLKALPCSVILVAHCNHPNELAKDTETAFTQLKDHGVTVLNQSVLLANVNDQPEILAALSEKLHEQGVLPYYLFLLDKVDGAAHFDLEESKAQTIYRELAAQLPGYLVPKLARELAGETSKTILGF